MDKNELRRENPAAWVAFSLLESNGATNSFVAIPLPSEIGWTESKTKRAFDRLESLGLIESITANQRRRAKIKESAFASATDKLRAVEAKETAILAPVRIEDCRLILSDGSGADLPDSMRIPELYDMWMQFARTMHDRRQRSKGTIRKNFSPEAFFKEINGLINVLPNLSLAHNICYVYIAYNTYKESEFYKIDIANVLADIAASDKAKKGAENAAPDSVPKLSPEEREKHVYQIIRAALQTTEMSDEEIKRVTDKKGLAYMQQAGDASDEKIQEWILGSGERQGAAIRWKNGERFALSPKKLGNFIRNQGEDDPFSKRKEVPKNREIKADNEVEQAFKIAVDCNPHFLAEMEEKGRKKLGEKNWLALSEKFRNNAMIDIFKDEMAEAVK